eukprot:jgi/Chrzof1/5992/UNPLg00840.t1
MAPISPYPPRAGLRPAGALTPVIRGGPLLHALRASHLFIYVFSFVCLVPLVVSMGLPAGAFPWSSGGPRHSTPFGRHIYLFVYISWGCLYQPNAFRLCHLRRQQDRQRMILSMYRPQWLLSSLSAKVYLARVGARQGEER